MTKLEELDQQIAELKKQKEVETLKIEIEKIKKTRIEETIVERRTIYREYPVYPAWPNYGITCSGSIDGIMPL